MNAYTKGAIWRVWDLQIQTILDDRYQSLDSYYEEWRATDTEKWNSYISKVGGEENALLFDTKDYFNDSSKSKSERCTNYVRNTLSFLETYKPHLGVVGLTDHNYYDSELLDTFSKYSKNTICKVICGVEINVGGVHMLVYFNNPPYGKNSFSEGIKTFLSKINVDTPKKDGVLTVSNKSCHDVINEIQQSDGIFLFPHCNSNNGLFQERGKTDRTYLGEIFNLLPTILLQGNSKENIDKTTLYINNNPALFKSQAVYTFASDGRCLNEFGNPDKDGNYQWIKGDPTFEGLKQIAHEPFTRVRIEKEQPEIKKDYLTIDKVRFVGAANKSLFSDEFIEINDKLNGIIGGKSSGKSILLYYIAKTIDPEQVKRKIEDSKLDLAYDFDKSPDFDFEVVWQDGTVYKLKSNVPEKVRQITYVPQMFINYLAERGGQQELRKLIQEILEQKPEFKTLYDTHISAIHENKIKLSTELEKYYQFNDDLKTKSENLRSKGDKSAREEVIRQKTQEIDNLRRTAGFSEEEDALYQSLKQIQDIYINRFKKLSGIKSLFENDYVTYLLKLKDEIKPNQEKIHLSSISKFTDDPRIVAFLSKFIQSDNQKINSLIDELVENTKNTLARLDSLLERNESQLEKYKQLLSPFDDKIKDQEKLEDLNKQIALERAVLNEIDELEKSISSVRESQSLAKRAFFNSYNNIFGSYKAIAETINGNPKFSHVSLEKGIVLACSIGFDVEKFRNAVIALINSQGYLNSRLGEEYIDTDNNFIYSEENHLQHIADFFDKIQNPSENQLRFNKGADSQSVSKVLLQDFFEIKYELSQNTESIFKMSPGKKGMILLFLILHLSNADYPILIDQPEDNLDNRTVYKELKEFIKEKKIMRQILMVTHNANLIVPTDAENVIVANQKGQDNNKDNEKFQFEYITGALENSFTNSKADGILNKMGIREHVCDVLEGGTEAFRERELKYNLKK